LTYFSTALLLTLVTLPASVMILGGSQGAGVLAAQAAQQQPKPDVPDAPTPQAPAPMSDVKDQVTPGSGAQPAQPQKTPAVPPVSSSGTQPDEPQAPSSRPPANDGPDDVQKTPPEIPEAGTGVAAVTKTIVTYTNFVEVPVTVKDSKGQAVAGLTFRDFRIYENNQRQQLRLFTVDPFPLSIAYVIDQSLTRDVMSKVNASMGSIQGSLTPYDDVAVFSYNNGAKELTGFTGAQSNRLTAVLEVNKTAGRDELVPVTSGPLAGCSITSNGDCVDPNLQTGRSAGSGSFISLPKEPHTLNDAILRAAIALSSRPPGRRRIIYVISDGKEQGSKAKTPEVIKYLQSHKIAVYATLVGDSARWGEGYLSRFHIPFQMNDDVLPKYTQATGGSLDAERGTNGIEKSYFKIADEARNQYTLGYISHEYVTDSRFRKIEVRVDRPNVEVTAKPGYYPTAQDLR
jgi:VWFA-related protein